MAGKIIADTLEHSTAGSVTTDFVVEGSAKAWSNIDGTGTVSARGSLNTSSITDNAVGDFSTNFTNSLENVNAVSSAMAGSGTVTPQDNSQSFQGFSTSSLRTLSFITSAFDRDYIMHLVHGDLA